MMIRNLALLSLLTLSAPFYGAEAETSNLPPDPFSELQDTPKAPSYEIDVDRTRGSFTIDAEDGQYQAGSHFANWFWNAEFQRWGNYYVGLLYSSSRPKLGVQIKVGTDSVLKGYAPRTNELKEREPMVLGTAYVEEPGEYPIAMLTGDQSNVPAFQVRGIHFQPAPESKLHGQSIDGTITLEAKTATTYSKKMRYEPKPEKNCLGFWAEKEDWAEWVFEVSSPGTFELKVTYGCGNGNEGSEVAVLVNDQTKTFTVEDTGGFQEWQELSLGKVDMPVAGKNRLAIVPQSQAAKGIMDIRMITLNPVSEE
ncbi:MAG: hypothetical protein AAGC68_11425 [Verrucomicrobiota bacterium]